MDTMPLLSLVILAHGLILATPVRFVAFGAFHHVANPTCHTLDLASGFVAEYGLAVLDLDVRWLQVHFIRHWLALVAEAEGRHWRAVAAEQRLDFGESLGCWCHGGGVAEE